MQKQLRCKQVDILISKNQALQILCLKNRVYKTSYHIVGFFEVLKFYEWPIFNGSAKSSVLQWIVHFFKGLNFMNDQHP